MDKIRIMFLPPVDAGNVNAQSLNVREIARRLDPERFLITLWYERQPDSRLLNQLAIRLQQLPPRRKTITILREMMAGYDIISYMDYSPASYLFLRMPLFMRRAKAVLHAEAPSAQLGNPSARLRLFYGGVVSRCDVYTAITEFVARDLQNSIGKKASHVLPVGVDVSLFTPPAVREHLEPVVLFAGTIIERKGPDLVIEAAARFQQAVFRIVGAARNGYDDILTQRISKLGLRNVKIDGPRGQAELVEIMRNADIFLLPSRLEGIPKVTLEAAATGLPCIVFRDYETPSVVNGITGFQVGTSEEMMLALEKLIGHPSLRREMGEAARQHVASFSWDVVSRKWQDAYLDIAARKP
jgi:glycosyltransferase involved in cell wall biosynthesis